MAELFVLLGKSIAIAIIAAIAAWAPWVFINQSDVSLSASVLPIALLGTFAVGLPIALLTYYLARAQLHKTPSIVFIAANLAGAVMVLVTYLLGDLFGGLFFGMPSLIAANVFAALGYFWIIKPERETLNV